MRASGQTGERSLRLHRFLMAEKIAGGLLGFFLLACVFLLWPEWLRNPDLSHGLATPFVFVFLLRKALRPLPASQAYPAWSNAGCAAACLLALTLFLGANLYAAALEWSHGLVLFLLSAAAGLFVWAGFLALSASRSASYSLNWPGFVAAAIWPLSAPIPPGTYTRMTQHLQAGVTDAVIFSLHLLGVTAGRIGNVITLARVEVGVEEACSGVRSLISCVFAALVLSAVICHRPWKRLALVAIAAPLALAMNFARSLLLTLLANNGIEIEGVWHDATGYAILFLTALLLIAIAQILERLGRRLHAPDHAAHRVSTPSGRKSLFSFGSSALNFSLAASFALWIVFFAKTRESPHPATVAPNLSALLPAEAVGWRVTTRDDLYQFSSQLQTNSLFERTYTQSRGTDVDQITIYVAYWPAGQVPVSLVESHTPDACWPGGGWVEDASAHQRVVLAVGARSLPTAEYRSFQLEKYPQNVWYWHLFDGAVIRSSGVTSPRELLSLAWRYGFRKDGEQFFIRVSSNRTWKEIAREPLMAEVFSRLRTTGL